ncbi:uric acid degradation bifunctional protein TTL isoform X1 [Dendrobium catenatum]|uniref:uric acid degradation bifunctional protein TTL isoform X1 n=2 Tax=Dendrobium catenatum TaxID=906689 RepID=UPI0009F2B816|nr:uric acid degradation bifunctional protein TTL isoform X1 [Dendrobium catenatum]
MEPQWTEKDFLRCSGSTKLAREMAAAAPFADLDHAVQYARDIWFNKVDVKGWLEAFAVHPEIGATSKPISQWSKEEQSAAMATSGGSTMQELIEWNARYKEKFGFVFLICASGRGSPEILSELKRRFVNRPIVELEAAAEEEMKIIELRLKKLFDSKLRTSSSQTAQVSAGKHEVQKDRIGVIGGHLMAVAKVLSEKPTVTAGRTRPPITTHVLDTARGSPASGLEVRLEMWKGAQSSPSIAERDSRSWVLHGSSITNSEGRTSPLMAITDDVEPGFYRMSFNTGIYNPSGFFPYVSIVFEIRESQKSEHFHVPLLLSPFSFSTYRGS